MEANPWLVVKKFKVPLLFFVLGILLYFNALFNGFVWDDNGYIINNASLHTFSLITIFGNSSINGYGYFYRPINALFLSVSYGLFHTQPFFYHFFQIVIHIINSMLIFLIFSDFFTGGIALFLALVFLVHPMQVESVAYISTVASPLTGLFGLSSLVLAKANHISRKRLLSISLLLMLSMLAKEDGVIYLFFLLLFTFLFRKKQAKQVFFSLGTIVLIYIAIRFVTGSVHPFALLTGQQPAQVLHAYAPIMRLSFVQRLLNIPAIAYYYLSTFVFPKALSVDQLWVVTSFSWNNFFLPLVVDSLFFLSVLGGGFLLFRSSRQKFFVYLFFFLWFFIGIGLYLQIIPLDMTVADRWFYLPSGGLLGMIGVGLTYVMQNKTVQKVSFVVALAVIAILGVRTMVRITNYQNEITLFSHDAKVRDNYDLEMNLGADYSDEGNLAQALQHLKKSVALFSSNVNLYDLAYVYEQTGDIAQAEHYYVKALSYPSYTQGDKLHTEGTYSNLAKLYLFENKINDAHRIISQGLSEYPASFQIQFYESILYYKEGKNEQAEKLANQLYQTTLNANALLLYNSIRSRATLQIPEGKQEIIIAPK